MSLQRRELLPEHGLPTKPEGRRSMSIALVRFCSTVAFCATSIPLFDAGLRRLGINYQNLLAGSENRDWRLVALFIGALVVGLIGGLLGLGIGASFKIRSDRVNFFLTVLWHYLANGTAGWIALTGFCLMQVYGKNAEAFWANTNGSTFMVVTLSIASLGSLVIGMTLLSAGQIKVDTRMYFLPSLILAAPLGVIMGYLQCIPLHVGPGYWWTMGILFPSLLMSACGSMIQKDLEERRKFAE